MKYLKRFNESLEDYDEIVNELNDMLISLRQDNPESEYSSDVSRLTYQNDKLLSIDVLICRNNRDYLTLNNLKKEIKPIIKQMVSYINGTMEFDHIILLVNYWDKEKGEYDTSTMEYSEDHYNSLIDYDTIVGIKLKFIV